MLAMHSRLNNSNVDNDSDNHHNQFDEPINPEDYANASTPKRNDRDRYQPSFASSPVPYDPTFITTSSAYGSHTPVKRAQSPGPRAAGNGTSSPSFTTGIFGTSMGIMADPGVRGRSPTRRPQSPARYYPDLETTSSPSRQSSGSLERTHVPPKDMGTFGTFNQSFTHPMKFEKGLARPPQQTESYRDESLFPPKREPVHTRSPVYRLDKASKLNSREMDHLENSMREALNTIDSHEKKVNILNDGGYRALSPEPNLPAHQERYVPPQSRSIFSPIQPKGSPVARSVSPARFNQNDRSDSSFSRTDSHQKFHSENPSLRSSSPAPVRVHPNSVSRQAIFPS